MAHALFLLIRLRTKAQARRYAVNLKRPTQALFALIGVFSLVVVLGAPWFALRLPEIKELGLDKIFKSGLNHTFLSMFFFCLAVPNLFFSSGKGVFFGSSEIDFLFPAPFARRALLGYKIASRLPRMAFDALLLTVWFMPFLPQWGAVYIGMLLAFICVDLLRNIIALRRLILVEQTFRRSRKIILRAGLFLVGLALWPCLFHGANFVEKVQYFRDSWAGIVLLAPFDVFSRVITSETLLASLMWVALAIVMNLSLFLFLTWLDARHGEAVATNSLRQYDRAQKQPHAEAIAKDAAKHPWQPRLFRYWRGAGPIAWRQLTAALRTTRLERWLVWILVIGLWVLYAVGAVHFENKLQMAGFQFLVPVMAGFGLWWIGGCGVWTIRCDFRSEIDRMELLKMLPLPPLSIAIGEFFAPFLICTTAVWIYAGSVAIIEPRLRGLMIFLLVLAPSFNLFNLGYENLTALLVPVSTRLEAGPDVAEQLRALVTVFLKYLISFLLMGLMLGFGALFYFLVGHSWVAFAAAVWLVLTVAALGLTVLVAVAFARFDPARDVPA